MGAVQKSAPKLSIMSISKTRQTLVDVARKLFAKQGLENTTMNDIAVYLF